MARTTSILDDVEEPGESPSKYDVMIFADSGAGKTTLLSTCSGRGLVLYTTGKEGYAGMMVLKRWRNRIKFRRVEDFDDYYKFYAALRDENPKRPPELRYDWVAFDSLTGAMDLAKSKVLAERRRPIRGKIKISGTEWGRIAGFIDTDLVQPFKTLPISTIWLAQEKDARRKRHGKIGPDITPGAAKAIRPAMLFIGRLYVMTGEDGEREQWMRIGPHDTMQTKYRAADRRLYVPQVIKEPHIERLVEFLYSDKGTECPFEEAYDPEVEEEEEEEYEEAESKKTKKTDPDGVSNTEEDEEDEDEDD